MEKEQSNPEFNFLFDTRCPEHAYYRWRMFSLAAGDTLRRWGCGGAGGVRGQAGSCTGLLVESALLAREPTSIEA